MIQIQDNHLLWCYIELILTLAVIQVNQVKKRRSLRLKGKEETEENVQELQPIYNVRGNELPVSYRFCILCDELNHTYQDCPLERELSFDICLAMSDLNANDLACISAYKGITTRENT
jgi:hypothetical protein